MVATLFAFLSLTQRLFGLDQPSFYIINLHLSANYPYHLKMITYDMSFTNIYLNGRSQMLQLTPTLGTVATC